MRLAIFSHVEHTTSNQKFFGYGPYVREMNLWGKYFDKVEVVAPLSSRQPGNIDLPYEFKVILTKTTRFDLRNFMNAAKTFLNLPYNLYIIASAMNRADHIHLRCPGNIGLLGCVMQIFFPHKPKSAKYAGNWDPKSKQPWSYKLQKWILNNTVVTRNMTVLVYGSWPGSSKNIKPFFTASYSEAQKKSISLRSILNPPIRFMFVGTLSPGKRPEYAIALVNELIKKGVDASLDIYGEGAEQSNLRHYIEKHQLEQRVRLLGNQPSETITDAYTRSHFLILPSISEGWPKVVAEAMFWGCVPLSTSISCVPQMLGNGSRGVLLNVDIDEDSRVVTDLLADEQTYNQMATEAIAWSRQYTTDVFEHEIATLLSNGNHEDSTINR